MHDIDGTNEFEQFETKVGEYELSQPELPLRQAQEFELVSRLLEVSDEQELEGALSNVFQSVGQAAGRFARPETGRELGAILKGAVATALPLVRGGAGGAPSDLAQEAGALLGLELEGLSPQDQEFEAGHQLVRMIGNAYHKAAHAPRNMPPRTAARRAAVQSARRYAPGLLQGGDMRRAASQARDRRSSGRGQVRDQRGSGGGQVRDQRGSGGGQVRDHRLLGGDQVRDHRLYGGGDERPSSRGVPIYGARGVPIYGAPYRASYDRYRRRRDEYGARGRYPWWRDRGEGYGEDEPDQPEPPGDIADQEPVYRRRHRHRHRHWYPAAPDWDDIEPDVDASLPERGYSANGHRERSTVIGPMPPSGPPPSMDAPPPASPQPDPTAPPPASPQPDPTAPPSASPQPDTTAPPAATPPRPATASPAAGSPVAGAQPPTPAPGDQASAGNEELFMNYQGQQHHHHHHHHHHGHPGYGYGYGRGYGYDYDQDDSSNQLPEDQEMEASYEMEGEGETPLQEVEEMEFASELLEVASEEELEEFLGDLISSVSKAAGSVIGSPLGRALTGTLKSLAKQALPVVGGALGSVVAPGVGTAIGSQLGSIAGGLFEFESEGMDHEQAEFTAARRFVALASKAAENAAFAPPGMPPHEVARQAVASAAAHYAPGLVEPGEDGGEHWRQGGGYEPYHDDYEPDPGQRHRPQAGGRQGGHWVRRGGKIILYGA